MNLLAFEKNIHSLRLFRWLLFPWKRSVWQNLDQERARTLGWTSRPSCQKKLLEDIAWPCRDMKCIFPRVFQERVQYFTTREEKFRIFKQSCDVLANLITKHLTFAAQRRNLLPCGRSSEWTCYFHMWRYVFFSSVFI